MVLGILLRHHVVQVEAVNEHFLYLARGRGLVVVGGGLGLEQVLADVTDHVEVAQDLHEHDRLRFDFDVGDVVDTPPDRLGTYEAV